MGWGGRVRACVRACVPACVRVCVCVCFVCLFCFSLFLAKVLLRHLGSLTLGPIQGIDANTHQQFENN